MILPMESINEEASVPEEVRLAIKAIFMQAAGIVVNNGAGCCKDFNGLIFILVNCDRNSAF